jgi:hypothetical protein
MWKLPAAQVCWPVMPRCDFCGKARNKLSI